MFEFNLQRMDDLYRIVEKAVEESAVEQCKRVDKEARQLLAMGYEFEELQMVQWPDGHKEVRPKGLSFYEQYRRPVQKESHCQDVETIEGV